MIDSHASFVSFPGLRARAVFNSLSITSLLCVLLSGPAESQTLPAAPAPASPTIVDAFVLRGADVDRTARLTDVVRVVVCKADYDAWSQGQASAHGTSSLTLYLDGNVMKGTSVNFPVPVDKRLNDDKLDAERKACADANPSVKSLESAARANEADAKAAAEKATNEKDPNIAQLKDNAAKLTAAALAARQQADAAWETASALDSFNFYLDPALVAAADSKDAWTPVLRKPWLRKELAISTGPTSVAWPSDITIVMKRISFAFLAAWAILFTVAIVVFVRFAISSDILRDSGTLPDTAPAGSRKAFSLARTQMALWTLIVAAALAFIFMVTWNENTVTNGVLVLLGISTGTTLLAAVADGTEPEPEPTKGFFADLFTDGTGPTVHRYQMVLFTVILAIIFIVKVGVNLTMPEFDATLLGLMGISNGTYLGFKLQGK